MPVDIYDGTQKIDDAVVRFTADWCVPCKRYAPLFAQAASKQRETWYVVDVDDFPEVAQEYRVMSIPAVFDHGTKVQDHMSWTREIINR